MSDTPRTDNSVVDTDWLGTRVELVNADFARKLERENAALLIDCDARRLRLAECRAENAALRADKERLDWLIKNQIGVAYGAVSFEAFDKITRGAIDAARKEAQS